MARVLVVICVANSEVTAELGLSWRQESLRLCAEVAGSPTAEGIIKLGEKLAIVKDYNSGTFEEVKVVEEIVATLSSVPGHAGVFRDRVMDAQKQVSDLPTGVGARRSYDLLRGDCFDILSYLKTPETILVLGGFLSDDVDKPIPLHSPGSDWGPNARANSYLSSRAFIRIGLEDPPVGIDRLFDQSDEVLVKTRIWWDKVSGGDLGFSFEGQVKVYRFLPDGSWKDEVRVDPSSDTPKPMAISAEPEEVKSPASGSKATPWGWVIVITGLMGLAGLWFWRTRVADVLSKKTLGK